jgi:hypothetical protein
MSKFLQMRGAEVKIDIDECLLRQQSESLRLNMEHPPAAAFSHPDMISRKKTVPCFILPMLERLLVNEFCHGCAVFK